MAMAQYSIGGYDHHWLEEIPDYLKCLICLCLARDPYTHSNGGCGKVFCYSCISKYLKLQNVCPNCRQSMTISRYVEGAVIIQAMLLRCSNLEHGCSWAGELRSLEDHQTICDYQPVSCKYAEVGCEEILLRKDLKKHEENDKLHLKITLESLTRLNRKCEQFERDINFLSSRQVSANDIIVTFKLDHFQYHLINNKIFNSASFYTSAAGYKMTNCIHANGTGEGYGTHLSVGTYLMKGDNDDSLPWPFTGTVTVELLNQLEDKKHHKKIYTFPAGHEASQRVLEGERAVMGFGVPQFIEQSAITSHRRHRKCQYLSDDSLVFRVSVQVTSYKPWLQCTM